MTISELSDILDSNPQSLVGKTYTGHLSRMVDDAGYFVLCGDYILIVDFDLTILSVTER